MKHKTKGFIAMILALCLMMSLGIGAMADAGDVSGLSDSGATKPGGNDSNSSQGVDGSKDDSGKMPGGGQRGDGSQGDPVTQADETYTVTVNTGDGATWTNASYWAAGTGTTWVTPSGGSLSVPDSSGVTLYFENKDGYKLTGITVTKVDGSAYPDSWVTSIAANYTSITFGVSGGGANVTVSSEPNEYSITNNSSTGSTGTITVPSSAKYGETVSVTVNEAQGYELASLSWSYNGTAYDITDTKSFTMPASNVTVTATFKATEPDPEPAKYTVSANEGQFSITGTGKYEEGSTVNLTITPNTGYYLYSVYIDGEYKEPGAVGYYTFTMPDHDVSVNVVAKPYSDWRDWHDIDTYSNSVDGGISVASGALEGSTVTFRVWSNFKYDYNYDYRVYVTNDRTGATVKCDYSSYYDEYSFTMPDDDVTISVYFDHVGDYTITKDVEGDGSIYVQSSADKGDTVWIEASPNAGQSLTSLRVFYGEPWAYGDKGYYGYWDEAEVKYSTYWDAYYFTMPADDVVVYARFTDGATVTVTSGDHGSAKVSSRYAEKGDWVYITAYPDDGYEVADVTVVDRLGKSVKVTELSSDYFLFTMPGTSVDVKVTFREVDYGYFYDVSRGDWYYEAVRYVYEKGIMEGTSAHYFSPNADLSRGMLATILYRLEGSPNVSGYSSFNDVADTSYYAKAIAWAERNGIVNGVTTERFEPDTAVTREQMAAILCRYADYKGHDTSVSYDYLATFGDSGSSHVYARPALNWAVAHRIINGQGSSVLAPRATATRAEVAQVLMNYLEAYD